MLVYLDAPDASVISALRPHPRLKVIPCDDAYWARRGRRPVKHQVRQTRNATHAYRRHAGADWLAHIDADEFIWPDRPVAEVLAALPADRLCARMRPMEMLAGSESACKRFIPPGPRRAETVAALYPRFGRYVTGGFLSHVAGKLFVRTGLERVEFRIHNVLCDGVQNPGQVEIDDLPLCHAHARDYAHWLGAYRYRLRHGAYRADLAPVPGAGVTLHEALRAIERDAGEAGLSAFFDEICADTPALRARLAERGLLRLCPLGLAAKRARHFGPLA